MRKQFEQQLTLGVIPINEVQFDKRSRHQLPEILKGLQYIFVTSEVNTTVFALLDSSINTVKSKAGRPGMTLWEILVLGSIRLALNIDYDELHDLCNHHQKLREILGVGTSDFKNHKEYALNTIKDNVRLLDSDLIDKINIEVVKAGHRIVKKKEDQNENNQLSLSVRGDSYVLERNIHFPTDISLVWDSARKVLDCLFNLGFELTGHRQLVDLRKKIRRHYLTSSEIHRKKGKGYQIKLKKSVELYLSKIESLLVKSKISFVRLHSDLQAGNYSNKKHIEKTIKELGVYIRYLDQCMNLLDKRILQEEIPSHSEKIFSIFEPETEWINKGKSGKSVELGHRHLIYTDQYQFILHHKVMENETDQEVALSCGKQVVENYAKTSYHFESLSYDRGFFSALAKEGLNKFYDKVIMPKPGKKNFAQQQEESSDSFVEKKRHHSGVEGNINSLEHTGLDKCPDKGIQSFKNYASLGVLAYNLRQLGKWIKRLEEKQAAAKMKFKRAA